MPRDWSKMVVFPIAAWLLLLIAAAWVMPPPAPLPPHVTTMPLHLSVPAGPVPTAVSDLL